MTVAKWLLFLTLIPSRALLAQVKDTTLTVYFSTDIYKLDSDQAKQIEQFAAAVSGISSITGYADSVGTVDYNLKLSMERAKSVADILKQKVSEQLVDYRGEMVVRSSELSKNRVVEIKAILSEDPIIDSFDIQHIFFLPDKPIITAESYPNVDRLVQRLKRYKKACFELIGHVNYDSKRPSPVLESMFRLSEQRAGVIKNILVENNISVDRIESRGVGNSQPLFPNPINDEQRKQNMRVQVVVYNCVHKE